MTNSYFKSIILHAGLILAAFLVTPPLLDKLDNKQITVELIDPAPVVSPVVLSPVVVAASKNQAEAKVEQKIKTAQIQTKLPLSKASMKSAVKNSAKSTSQKSVHADVPASLDDIENTDLDYDSVAVDQASALNEKELDTEFSKVDKKTDAKLVNQKSEFENEIKKTQNETEEALADIEKNNKQDAKAMSASLESTRAKNAATLARIKVGEEAAARDAAAAKLASLSAAKKSGNGNSSSGSATGAIRSIENLKQLKGNPTPSYSMDERFRKEQGTVIFQAFVTADGQLKDFKLVQSTGFRNLDGKTLAALKKWKFYPGQQGWVEIPQTWNIKGEAEEMPATLRRKISQR